MSKIYIEVQDGMVVNVWSREPMEVVILDHDDEDYSYLSIDPLTDETEESLNQQMGDWLEQQDSYEWSEEEDNEDD